MAATAFFVVPAAPLATSAFTATPRLCVRAPPRTAATPLFSANLSSPNPNSPSSTSTSTCESTEDRIVDGPFSGQFGTWYLRERDVTDVWLYRSLLLTSALSFLPVAVLPHSPLHAVLPDHLYDGLLLCSASALGLALKYIHIYMRPLHSALKVTWSVGMVGCALSYVCFHSIAAAAATDHPISLAASGWVLVAAAGVFAKEAFCFRTPYALALATGVPLLSAGHFLGLLGSRGNSMEAAALAGLGVVYTLFAAAKFNQDVKDDIGDLSVFEYLDKQEREQMRQQQQDQRRQQQQQQQQQQVQR